MNLFKSKEGRNGERNIEKNARKKTIVIIDNENLRGSIKKISSQKNINYLEFIEFLKNKFAKDSKIVIYLVVSLLGVEKSKNDLSFGILNFLRAMRNLEIGFEANEDVGFKLIEVSAKRERVYLLDQKDFGMAEVSQVDQKILNLFMKEALICCQQGEQCKFVLVSGDGDFLETLTILRKYISDEITVISSEKSCNDILKRVFDVSLVEDILKENPSILLPSTNNQKQVH